MTKRSLLRAATLVLVLGAAPSAALRADPPLPDVVEAYDRRLPQDGTAATVVVDDETGKPIERALVRAFTEDIDTRTLEFGRVPVGEQATDAQGVASLPLLQGEADHWLVTAAGYAPEHEFGYWPPKIVRLQRGRDLRFRVVDLWRAPIAGARVEAYPGDGCPHAPAFWRGTTGADGMATIADGPPDGCNLWIDAKGYVVGVHSTSSYRGTTPDELVLEPATTIRGTILSDDAKPLVGAVVRGADFPRGPATRTDDEGKFELAGIERGGAVMVAHPDRPGSEEDKAHTVRRTTPDLPLDVQWTEEGFAEAKESGELEIRVKRPAKSTEDSLEVDVVAPDGRPTTADLSWDDDSGAFAHSMEVPVGVVWIRSVRPTDPIAVPETRVEIKASVKARVEIEGRARVPLRLAGMFDEFDPKHAAAYIAVGDDCRQLTLPKDIAPDGALAHLDPDVPARLLLYGGELGRAVADIGQARVVRTAPVLWTKDAKTTIRVRSKKPIDDLSLYLDRDLEHGIATDPKADTATVVTDATGPLLLVVELEGEEHDHVLPIDVPVPKDEKAELVVDLDAATTKQTPVGPIVLDVSRVDGKPLPPLEVRAEHLIGRNARGDTFFDATSPVTIGGPSVVTIEAKGMQPLRQRISAPGSNCIVWPAGAIRATITDAYGKPAAPIALLDGVLHEVGAEGRLEVAGLAGGPHALVVSPAKGKGLLWRFTLADGEAKERSLKLPEVLLDEEAPYERTLPGSRVEEAATVVVDAVTLEPIPGARVRWYPELAADNDIEHSWVIDEGVADEFGVAVLRLHEDFGDKHFVALADGYAAVYEYGKRPPERMAMRRGRPYVGQLKDPFGSVIAGATVEFMLGCGHGPGVFWATTDENGLFRFDRLPADVRGGNAPRLWITAPGLRAAYVDTDEGDLGARPHDVVLPPGVVAKGAVLGLDGRPLAGVVVRQFLSGNSRGPATKTLADGTFMLTGADAGASLDFYHPAAWGRLSGVSFVEDRPITVRLGVIEPELPDPDATIRVRVVDEKGEPVLGGPLVRAVSADGRVEERSAAEKASGVGVDRVRVGEAWIAVPAGRFEIRTAGPFEPVEWKPTTVEVKKGSWVGIDVKSTPRPRLRIDGAEPEKATVWCEGESTRRDEPPRVPADKPVAVEWNGLWATAGPVAKDGTRHVDFETERRHRVRWPASLKITDAELLHAGHLVAAAHVGDALLTFAEGPCVLRLRTPSARNGIDVPVVLPHGEPIDVLVDPEKDGRPAESSGIHITPTRPQGADEDASFDLIATDGETMFDDTERWPVERPFFIPFASATVRVSTRGFAPLVVQAKAPARLGLLWPTASLVLTVVGRDGKPVASRLLLDGEFHDGGDDGRVEVFGITPGEHRALVMDADRTIGRVWRFAIRDGQRVEKRVRLVAD